jgi:putative addiction module antidote
MMKEVAARRVGGSIGTTLPKDMAERLHIEPGDKLFAIETQDGILLTPFDPRARQALSIAAELAKKYRNALSELAK